MPPYCRTCPYNTFCDERSFAEDLCPIGYVPSVKSDTMKNLSGTADEPLDIEILIKSGKNAYNNDDYERAIKCYEKILEIEPTNQEAGFLKKRTEFIISELSGTNEDEKQELSPEAMNRGTPLTLPQEPAIHVGHSKALYYDSVSRLPTESKEVFTVHDTDHQKDSISKQISIKTHGSVLKKKGIKVIFAIVMVWLIAVVVLLWIKGYL